MSKKEKWAIEIILNLTHLFNKRKKNDGIRRKAGESSKTIEGSRDSDKSDKE